jgi:hypothetical protein
MEVVCFEQQNPCSQKNLGQQCLEHLHTKKQTQLPIYELYIHDNIYMYMFETNLLIS